MWAETVLTFMCGGVAVLITEVVCLVLIARKARVI